MKAIMKAEGAVGLLDCNTCLILEAAGAVHRPPMRIEIGFHDPASAEFSDSFFSSSQAWCCFG
jgi:hypothetical protein